MSDFDYDVAVVGVGPVGAVLANLLGLQGVRTIAIDRLTQAQQLPRGVGIDGEMMRVAQTVGLAETLEPLMKVFPGTQYLDAQGKVIATRPGLSGSGTQGWPDRYQMHQPDFEEVFRSGMQTRPSLTRHYGYEVTEVRNDAKGGAVISTTQIATGKNATITARYVVGCDGASSIVRKAAHVTFDDFGLNEPWVVADFEVDDQAGLPDVNTHYADSTHPVIFVNVVRNLRRYEFRMGSNDELDSMLEPDSIWHLVSRWLTPEHAKLVRAAVYTHRSIVAKQWRDGALLVAGDAAHQTPPFLGQGLCAGMRDASGLAWRLGSVIVDHADESLLDSYGAERSAHAAFIIKAATALGQVYRQPDKEKLEAINDSIGREGRGQTPRLGPGLWLGDFPAGTLAPQPRLSDGRLLDDLIGYHFGVIASPHALAQLSQEIRRRAKAAGFGLVEASGEVSTWLAESGAMAVILRPDRYYFGAFHDANDLEIALRGLVELVAPTALAS